MSKVNELMATLPPHQQNAVKLVKVSLDCFNSRDGTGLFAGVERYAQLGARASICAVQAGNSLTRFWGLLLAKMQWPTPPKRADAEIIEAIGCGGDAAALAAIATETASIIMLARALHDEDKQQRRDYHAALREEQNLPGDMPPAKKIHHPDLNDALPL